MAVLSWAKKPYPWIKVCLWYLAFLALYQFIFTFTYFLRLYIEDIPGELLLGLQVFQACMSAAAIYLMPLTIFHYCKKTITGKHYLIFAIPAAALLISLPLILVFKISLIPGILNPVFYLYIGGFSLFAYFRGGKLNLPGDAEVMRYFFLINTLFNAFFFIDLLFLELRLPQFIPGTVLIVPLYILSWALLFIFWFSPFGPRKKKAEENQVSEDFIKNYGISRRERDVLLKLAEGQSSRQISEELYVSVRTVDTHIYNIFRKCGVKSRLELLALLSRFKAT